MNRINKTIPNLQKVWNKFDKAYENLEAAFEMLEEMTDLPEELQSEMDRFDLSAVSSLKQQVEMMMEDKESKYEDIMENKFKKPETPFLLLSEDIDGAVSYYWWNNEKDMIEDAVERRENGEKIVCAIEISSYRDVEIPSEYTVDDFIEEVNSAYENAKENGFDSIVLAIDTNCEETYYINDTNNGFQCDEFDFYFEDLDSIATALFDERMIGKPVEIRIE